MTLKLNCPIIRQSHSVYFPHKSEQHFYNYINVIMQEKLKLYLDYVENHSFFGDIGLIFKTFWVIVTE